MMALKSRDKVEPLISGGLCDAAAGNLKVFHLQLVASHSQTATSVGDDSGNRPEVLAVNNQLFLFGRELIQSVSSGPEEAAAVPLPPVSLCVCLSVCSATWTLARLHKKLG